MAAKKGGTQTHLSKNVLQMKFMQKSVLRIEKEQNEDERQKIIDDEHWVIDLPEYKKKESQYLVDQSYLFCEELVFGRQSFMGFNPEVEKLMKAHSAEQESKKIDEAEEQNSISDKEMVKRYSSLMGVLAKKFAKKRSRKEESSDEEDGKPIRKKAFIKPEED